MNIIADASSLIVLARLDGLGLLERMFASTVITPMVEAETVHQGKARGYRDALRIEAAIMAGQLVVMAPTESEEQRGLAMTHRLSALSLSDCLTLVCAQERQLMLLMEDRRARNVAIAEGIGYLTLQVLPLYGLINGQTSFDECEGWLGRIGQAMRSDPAIVGVLRAAAGEIARLRNEEGQ